MKNLIFALAAFAFTACSPTSPTKVTCYAWQGEGQNTTEETLQSDFSKWKSHGIDGMCYNAGHDVEKHRRAAQAAKANGMEYHAWIPAMLQSGPEIDSTWYAVNRNGESAYTYKPMYPITSFFALIAPK
jgi:hypothetical protein